MANSKPHNTKDLLEGINLVPRPSHLMMDNACGQMVSVCEARERVGLPWEGYAFPLHYVFWILLCQILQKLRGRDRKLYFGSRRVQSWPDAIP